MQQGKRPSSPPSAKEPAQLGRGGQQHRYLQHLFKQLAEERGLRASIEAEILDGAGQVDVALVRGELRIACEISVTTNRDQELGNVEKCLATGYPHVILVGGNQRHVKTLSKFFTESLEENDRGKVRYLTTEEFINCLESYGQAEPVEQTVRGYKVRTVQQVLDPAVAGARRRAIASVIARSALKKSKER